MSFYIILGATAVAVDAVRQTYQQLISLREEANFVYSLYYPNPDPNSYPTGQIPDRDAFRHAYSSAMLVYHLKDNGYTSTEANLIAKLAGYGNEWLNPNNFSNPEEMYKDIYNNKEGREIGDAANSMEDIPDAVRDAMDEGDLVKDTSDPRSEENPDPFIDPQVPLEPTPIPLDPDYCPGAPWIPEGLLPGMDQANGEAYPKLDGSPLIIDMDGDGIELTNLDTNAVYWDIDNDGFKEKSAWVTGGDALLVMDWNANGTIDNNSELFGTIDTDGFSVLSLLDSNSDGVIDSSDDDFDDLKIWIDVNENGISEATELQSLTDANIVSINLNATQVSYDISGNSVTHTSTVTMSNSTTKAIVDAWFEFDNSNTIYTGDFEVDIRTLFMPNLRGYGDIKDLYIQASLDEGLLDKALELADMSLEEVLDADNNFDGKFREMLYQWGGTQNLSLGMDSADYDYRKTDFLDMLSGRGYRHGVEYGQGVAYYQGTFLTQTWQLALNALESRFLAQTVFKPLFEGTLQYDWASDDFSGATGLSSAGLATIASYVDNSSDKNYSWTLVVRVIEGVLGIDNLSNGDRTLLDNAIQADLTDHDLDAIHTAITEGIDNDIVGDYGTSNTLTGTGSDDLLGGGGQADTLIGGYGDDRLYGMGGNDTYIGGMGDDYYNDAYYGGGNDTYVYHGGRDYIEDGTSGSDKIQLASGIVLGDISIERLDPTDAEAPLLSTQRFLVIHVEGYGDITIFNQYSSYGSVQGIETLEFSDTSTIDLTTLDTWVYGTSSGETLTGQDRSYYLRDMIDGGQGDDTLDGGLGNDVLYGGWGNDTYLVGEGVDIIQDTDGTDEIVFDNTYDPELFTFSFDPTMSAYEPAKQALKIYYDGELKVVVDQQFAFGSYFVEKLVIDGVDEIDLTALNWDQYGTLGNDSLYAINSSAVNAVVYGLDGNDTINGSSNNDGLHGGIGDDNILGQDGDDLIFGDEGNDSLNGGWGNDVLYGGAGDDYIVGGFENDILSGGAGTDTLYGGSGADTFVFEVDSAFANIDIVTDFSTGQGDAIDISDLLTGYTSGISDINDFVSITESGGNTNLFIDRDGTGGTYSATKIATLEYVTGLDVDTLLSNNNLIAA